MYLYAHHPGRPRLGEQVPGLSDGEQLDASLQSTCVQGTREAVGCSTL